MSSDQKLTHREYISSVEWKVRAKYYKEQAGNRCRVCNSDSDILDAHHRTYERLGNELDSDITVLCRACHTLFESRLKGKDLTLPAQRDEWVKAVHDERSMLYNTVLAQAIAMSLTPEAIVLFFGPEHHRLAQHVADMSGYLSDVYQRVNRRRVVVVGLCLNEKAVSFFADAPDPVALEVRQ
jgi:hypothetical protein